MSKKSLLILVLNLLLITSLKSQLINMNPDHDGDPWWAGGLPEVTPEIQKKLDAIPELKLSAQSAAKDLPAVIDNSTEIFFRPIFSQSGGSCGQASGVGYTYTYEINRLRNLPADTAHPENQYPTHYTWNYFRRTWNCRLLCLC